jgi:hypothetical protein
MECPSSRYATLNHMHRNISCHVVVLAWLSLPLLHAHSIKKLIMLYRLCLSKSLYAFMLPFVYHSKLWFGSTIILPLAFQLCVVLRLNSLP